MRISLQWLQELVQASAAELEPASLAERLSIAGFEVEEILDLRQQAAGVVVGYVRDRQPHPDATKLSVCQVDVGSAQPLQIVCGAANVRSGIHVPVALVGSTLPAVKLTIKPAELRGVASSGMICSLSELGLADSSDGIAILDELLAALPPLGSPVASCFGLDDTVLELAITANRPDGLSMLGIAREVAALVGCSTLVPSGPSIAATALPVPATTQRSIEQGGLFSITALDGLQVGPSPRWLQQRLEKAGIRSINNVVDITNLVMLETGQPLHAFDSAALGALGGGQADPASLGLRQGRQGEAFTALDGETRDLSPEALVVTYADTPIALAGVIGGDAEAVGPSTTSIWLEAAVFAPQAVRLSARSLGLRTEASSRFEKGLPRQATLAAADRAVALLQELGGAQCRQRWVHQLPMVDPEPIVLRRDALHNLLGPLQDSDAAAELHDLDDDRICQTLQAIGCQLTPSDEGWRVLVPAQRAIDLQREVDLIEEVARLVGYDRFAAHLPDPLEPGGLLPQQQIERRLRRGLCAAGLQEVCSFSLVSEAPQRLPLANPLLADYGHLRDALHSELLAAARRNLQSGQSGFWGFEIGTVFASSEPEARSVLAGVISGERRAELWSSSGKPRPLDYHQARGRLQQALVALALPLDDRPLKQHPLLHPGRAAELCIEGRAAGWFGQLHPAQALESDLPEATYLFELDLARLLTAASRQARWQPSFKPFATVPASERDLAVLTPVECPSAELLSLLRKAGKPLLEHVELIDTFSSDQLGAGVCSKAYRLRYRDPARTLTDADVDQAHARVRAAIEARRDLQLRS
ncbi:MAG: phenylalanine--tRNA ligase subunit beta [Cyanobacteriota bacterium]|nr:phenylalanine--tRNA ligase subunit beta [Cyanobacteriota bacterium]